MPFDFMKILILSHRGTPLTSYSSEDVMNNWTFKSDAPNITTFNIAKNVSLMQQAQVVHSSGSKIIWMGIVQPLISHRQVIDVTQLQSCWLLDSTDQQISTIIWDITVNPRPTNQCYTKTILTIVTAYYRSTEGTAHN